MKFIRPAHADMLCLVFLQARICVRQAADIHAM